MTTQQQEEKPRKRWMWGFVGPIPYVYQEVVPQPATPREGAQRREDVSPALEAYRRTQAIEQENQIDDDEIALGEKVKSDQKLRASDLKLDTEHNLAWADLNLEAAWKMKNNRLARRKRWTEALPEAMGLEPNPPVGAATPPTPQPGAPTPKPGAPKPSPKPNPNPAAGGGSAQVPPRPQLP